MLRVLITGSKGQLGSCIKDLSINYTNIEFTFVDSSELNITRESEVKSFFAKFNFDWCVNCAAYTAVDLAENEQEIAETVNVLGSKHLAESCNTFNVKLIHISTDFVFDGNSSKAYKETDITNPLGIYGLTKLKGEQEIANYLDAHYIIRTSWLYSEHGNNFLKTMLRLAKDRDELNVVSDQIGTPTYAKDLASTILNIIMLNNNKFGIYHYSNEGVISWYDFAKAIFDIQKISLKTNPIPSEKYPTPAKRPAFSVLDKTKIKNNFKTEIPYWRDSLKIAISNL